MLPQLYEVIWLFLIYAFFGWCSEVIFATCKTGVFVNRGFLNGPVCPIYGCGFVLVLACLTPIKDNVIVLFFGALFLTTLIEFLTGWILEKFFKMKWWDYTDEPFNIKGYVCLRFSILWGLACVSVMKIVQPPIDAFVGKLHNVFGYVIFGIFVVAFIVDFVITLVTLLKIPKKYRVIIEMEKTLHGVSDKIGSTLSDGTANIIEKGELKERYEDFKEFKDDIEEKKDEFVFKSEESFREVSDKFKQLTSKVSLGEKRLLKAFPNLKESTYEKGYVEARSRIEARFEAWMAFRGMDKKLEKKEQE